MDDAMASEAESALLLRPSHTLTREEKLERRRLQYKLHQRRHRARQKDLAQSLASEIQTLADQVAQLQRTRVALQSQSTTAAPPRSVSGGGSAASQVAMEYVRQFQFGVGRHAVAQEAFLRATMAANVGGPDYHGIEELVHQWRLYGRVFHRTQYVPDGVDVFSPDDDMTVVVVRIELVIRAKRDGVLCLCPRLRYNEAAIQAMVGHAIRVPGTLRFVFDADGACTWLGADMDFVGGLQRVLGNLSTVAACMEDANMSFCTGQISPGCLYDDGETMGPSVRV